MSDINIINHETDIDKMLDCMGWFEAQLRLNQELLEGLKNKEDWASLTEVIEMYDIMRSKTDDFKKRLYSIKPKKGLDAF